MEESLPISLSNDTFSLVLPIHFTVVQLPHLRDVYSLIAEDSTDVAHDSALIRHHEPNVEVCLIRSWG